MSWIYLASGAVRIVLGNKRFCRKEESTTEGFFEILIVFVGAVVCHVDTSFWCSLYYNGWCIIVSAFLV